MRRCVEEASAREEAAALRNEALSKELSTLKREAVLEVRKLRAMMEATLTSSGCQCHMGLLTKTCI